MSLKFEGAIDGISERQLVFIREAIERRGFNNTNVILEPVGKAGDNFTASLKRITINNNNGVFKMIAKIAPQNENVRNLINTHNTFKKEHHMYVDVLSKFQELQAVAEVPNEDRLRVAACYGSTIEAPHEVILLEDLQVYNFILLDRFKSLSNECVKSLLKNFACLHSLSYALKNKEPETFKALTNNLVDMLSSDGQNKLLPHLENLEKETEKLVEGAKRKSVLRGAVTQFTPLAMKNIKTEMNSKHSVIQHGDAWINNFMFKFDDAENLKESMLIDYQQSKENNPVCDILYMIFTCTDYNMRSKHFHEWLDYYHSELDRCLSNFGLKANYLYPREKFDADMKRYSKQIFGQAVIAATVLTMNTEEASKVNETLETIMNGDDSSNGIHKYDFNHTMLYVNKVQGLIDSCLEFGLL